MWHFVSLAPEAFPGRFGDFALGKSFVGFGFRPEASLKGLSTTITFN